MLEKIRYYTKIISMPVVFGGALLFAYQFLLVYIAKGIWFWVMYVAIIFWILDAIWSWLHDVEEIREEIQKHEREEIERKMNINQTRT